MVNTSEQRTYLSPQQPFLELPAIEQPNASGKALRPDAVILLQQEAITVSNFPRHRQPDEPTCVESKHRGND